MPYTGNGCFCLLNHSSRHQTKDFTSMKKQLALLSTISAAAFAINAQAATKWDLPSAYPPSNLHTQTLAKFVKAAAKLSGGDLKSTLHSNASLFSAPQIKHPVQGGQAQKGER